MPNVTECELLHRVVNSKYFPHLKREPVPSREKLRRMESGVCLFTESRQTGHGGSRIVYVGSNGKDETVNKMLDRYERLDLREEFPRNLVKSVVQKELDRLEGRKKKTYDLRMKMKGLESLMDELKYEDTQVPEYIREKAQRYLKNFKCLIIGIPRYEIRKMFEEKIASTVYNCPVCEAKPDWPGNHIGLEKLWVEGEMRAPDWSEKDLEGLKLLVALTEEGYTGQKTLMSYL